MGLPPPLPLPLLLLLLLSCPRLVAAPPPAVALDGLLQRLGGVVEGAPDAASAALRVAETIREAGLTGDELAAAQAEGQRLVIAASGPPPPRPRLPPSYAGWGGRVLHARRPVVHVFDEFFSSAEAAHLIRLARPRLERSVGMADNGRTPTVFGGRTSQTAGVDPTEDEPVANLTRRIALVTGLGVENLEPISITRYTGTEQVPHHPHPVTHHPVPPPTPL